MARHYPACKPLVIGNVFRGPYNNRTLSQVSYAEFADNDAASVFIEAVKAKPATLSSGGSSVQIKLVISKLNLARNYALKKATEMIKADAAYAGATVETKGRTVMVGDAEAFVQDKSEPGGRFVGSYSHLALP